MRLWEANHPYYCAESNFYVGGMPQRPLMPGEEFAPFDHYEFDSWAAFGWKDSDPDLNLVFRWDWQVPDPDDYEEGEEVPGERLLLFVMHQRKGRFVICSMPVQRSEEPEIRAWLTERKEAIRAAGFDLRQSPITYGVTDISFPVFGFDREVIAAL